MDFFLTQVRPFLFLTTPKLVKIRDLRLGLALLTLRAGVIAWAIFTFFTGRTYLKVTSPTVVVSLYADAGNFAQAQEYEFENFGSDNHGICNPNTSIAYDYIWSDDWVYNIDACSAYGKPTVALKMQTMRAMFINTMSQHSLTQRFQAPRQGMSDADCQAHLVAEKAQCVPRLGRELTPAQVETLARRVQYKSRARGLGLNYVLPHMINGSCECSFGSATINSGAEQVVIRVSHSVRGVHLKSKPPTFVRTHEAPWGEFKTKFQGTQTTRFSLQQLLDWLELDLDKPANDPANKRWLPEDERSRLALQGPSNEGTDVYPKLRIAGMRILATVEYFNRGVASQNYGVPLAERDAAVITLMPTLDWTTLGDDVESAFPNDVRETSKNTYRYGVAVEFEGGGAISKLDWSLVLKTLIDSFVLLNMCSLAVQYLAMYGMGVRSMLYKELIEEQVTIISQYARFVFQALTAALVFKMLDADESGQIDADELEETVASIFTGKLDKKEVDSLVDIAIDASHQQGVIGLEDVLLDMKRRARQANRDAALGRPSKPKQIKSMNLQQFIHAFTGPPCTLAGCGALTQQLKRTSEKQALEKSVTERMVSFGTLLSSELRGTGMGSPDDKQYSKDLNLFIKNRKSLDTLHVNEIPSHVDEDEDSTSEVAHVANAAQMDAMVQRQSEIEQMLKSQQDMLIKQAASIEYLVKWVAVNDAVDRALGERGATVGVRDESMEDRAD